MTKYEIYDTVRDAIKASMPDILRTSVVISKKIDSLPDICTQKSVAQAIGVTPGMIQHYIKSGIIDPVFFPGSRVPRIRKSDVLEIFIQEVVKL